jgi:uncharacterized membrane protein
MMDGSIISGPMIGGPMIGIMGVLSLLTSIVLILSIAALVKYLFFDKK